MRASTWRREAEIPCHRRAGAGILMLFSGFARSSRLRNLGVRPCTRARPNGSSLALPTVPMRAPLLWRRELSRHQQPSPAGDVPPVRRSVDTTLGVRPAR